VSNENVKQIFGLLSNRNKFAVPSYLNNLQIVHFNIKLGSCEKLHRAAMQVTTLYVLICN